jgi:hypothetical protein
MNILALMEIRVVVLLRHQDSSGLKFVFLSH